MQHLAPMPAVALACVLACVAGPVGRQIPESTAFEVASIRPLSGAVRTQCPPRLHVSPGGIVTDATLGCLIRIAYKIGRDQLTGDSGWIGSTVFRVDARTSRPAGYAKQMVMMQSLLASRFGLRLTWHQKSTPAFALVVLPGGAKLRRASPASAPSGQREQHSGGRVDLADPRCTISELAGWLQFWAGRRVIDGTGLLGTFSIHLSFFPEDATQAAKTAAGPTLAQALASQLGLGFKPTRLNLPVLRIEGAHRPTPN